MKKLYKNNSKECRYVVSVLVLMLGVVLNSTAQYDFMGIRYKGDTVEIPRAKPYKSGKSIPSLDFSIDSIRPLDELVTGNEEAYPWLSPDGNRIYYVEGYKYTKIYMAEKKAGGYRFSNLRPVSFKNYNITTYYHGIWLSNDELNIYFIQTSDTAKTFANLYYAKRDSIKQEFSEPKKIKLIASNIYNYASPSFTQDMENLYLILVQDTNLIINYYLCRFIRTGEDEYTLNDTINIPDGYYPLQGMLTSDDLKYILILWEKETKIYIFKRTSIDESFSKLYYINNSYLYDTVFSFIGTPYFSLNNNALIYSTLKDITGNNGFLNIAYNLQEINYIISLQDRILYHLYPNPVNKYFEIIPVNIYHYYDYVICNLSGQQIKSGYFTSSIKLDLSSYTKGIYILKMYDRNTKQLTSHKIVKM